MTPEEKAAAAKRAAETRELRKDPRKVLEKHAPELKDDEGAIRAMQYLPESFRINYAKALSGTLGKGSALIRSMCVYCGGGSLKEAQRCLSRLCPLYAYMKREEQDDES